MNTNITNILIIIINFYLIKCYGFGFDYDSPIKTSIGGLWPKPHFQRRCVPKLLDPNNFEFLIVGNTCDILEQAKIRYEIIIKNTIKSPIYHLHQEINPLNIITQIIVNLTNSCERLPHFQMDESYKILGSKYITANSIWGILRAFETYSQAVTPANTKMLTVPHLKVIDSPRFPHRGLMLDTARHFISINKIFTILDGMSYNKLNVFHWHIVDDQSFPYQSIKFPELSEKGAYMPSMVYTQENISNIIEYARMRGIRVLIEFALPGHTRSYGNSHPEILAICEWWSTKLTPIILGPLDPIRKRTYTFLKALISEVTEVFPDKYMHIGGDEIELSCWENNEEISNYITANHLTIEYLFSFLMSTVAKFVKEKLVTPIVWQEAVLSNFDMPNDTIVQVQLTNWKNNFKILTNLGYRVILSECWSLNKLPQDSPTNWKFDYNCDPYDFDGNDEQKQLVIGGEAIIWSNIVGNNNVIQKIFPRICAAAERLWSKQIIRNITDASQRIEEHTCRMILRGIKADSPSGLAICEHIEIDL